MGISNGSSITWSIWAQDNFGALGSRIQVGDFNGDGKSDLYIYDSSGNHRVGLSTGSSIAWSIWLQDNFGDVGTRILVGDFNGDGKSDLYLTTLDGNQLVGTSTGSSLVWNTWAWEGFGDIIQSVRVGDFNGDGKSDLYFYDQTGLHWIGIHPTYGAPNLITFITNPIGGSYTITYTPSSAYYNTLIPFTFQTVSSISAHDGRGNTSTTTYSYSGGLYDYSEREFRGFRQVTAYKMWDLQTYDSMTDTWFFQDYYKKGKIEAQIVASAEGHTRRVDNTWENIPTPGGGNFPSLKETTLTAADVGFPSYSQRTTYIYDPYGNVTESHKYGMSSEEDIHTYFNYVNFQGPWILSKPTEITIKNSSGSIVSKKWMDYDPNTGNLMNEEACKSDTPNTGCAGRNAAQNPVITYYYYPEGNLSQVVDPGGNTTTFSYDSTKTFVHEKTNSLTHKTTTVYDPGTGNLLTAVPPHLQATSYSFSYTYDALGRKTSESRPDGGGTFYQYLNFGNPASQYVEKRETIAGGASPLDHYTFTLFDGLGRVYWLESTGADGKRIITRTSFDSLGRVQQKSNPYYNGDPTYYTTFTYDGLSRVVDVLLPDNNRISTNYQGLKKVGINQAGNPTTYTYDVSQRLKTIEDALGTATVYSYDPLGNLLQVIAASGRPEQNITIMTYDSLSRKRTMTDPDMGYWSYAYDKSGNLVSQSDNKNQTIGFTYDILNRLIQKSYPTYSITYTYDDLTVPFSEGKQTKISVSGSTTNEDLVIEYDLMQRVKKSRKNYAAESVNFEKSYDTAGRAVSIKYLAGTYAEKIYNYAYNAAGNLLYVNDYATGNHLVDFLDFTPVGQQKVASYPKPNNISVKSTYTFDPSTFRPQILITQKFTGQTPVETYQNLAYQFDALGNPVQIVDTLSGAGSTTQSYQYDRIGNITYKSDVGSYLYYYADKPHAVRSAGNINFQYDPNGNMTQRAVYGGNTLDIQYNYDNKPELIRKNGNNFIQIVYDGSGRRVEKYNYNTGLHVLYFGDLYEIRNGVGVMHIFAGTQRIASVRADANTQFYHANYLKSASVVADQNGEKKERLNYFPFGTYSEAVDYDSGFPNVSYTFTDQEEDNELGLYNFQARFYDPLIGRFISPDSIVPDPGDLQTFNRYSYCRNNPLTYIDPTGNYDIGDFIDDITNAGKALYDGGKKAFDAFTGGVSTVAHDWFGINDIDISFCFGPCVEFGIDFRNGVDITHVGTGIGGGVNIDVSTNAFDIGGGVGGGVFVGYDNNSGIYVSGNTTIGPAGFSAKYSPGPGNFSVSAGVGSGPASLTLGYSNAGGLSASPGLMGAYYNTSSGRVGFNVDPADLKSTYDNGVNSRERNGYGPDNGGQAFKIIDIIGTITSGWQPSDLHDLSYETPGFNKASADFNLFKDMVSGSVSNLAFKRNGFIKAAVGLAISPIYYSAVVVGGGPAYRTAQMF